MKILVITQTVDSSDTTLGFFHGWLQELSSRFDFVHVICLFEGKHNFSAKSNSENSIARSVEDGFRENVSVHSLGKESGASKLKYVLKFYWYIMKYYRQYDVVFVHMNQEYVILGGFFWKLFGKKVFFWRNHSSGNIWTRLAVFFSTKVFCTSPLSFTARFKKTSLMPVGINVKLFKPMANSIRNKNSICMVGRVAPIKNLDKGLLAVKDLIDSGRQVTLSVVGSPLPKDQKYYSSLLSFVEKNNLKSFIKFVPAVSPENLPEIYRSHEICLNLTGDGSFDKTIVEAAACGAIPLTTSRALSDFLPEICVTDDDAKSIAVSLENLLHHDTKVKIEKELNDFVQKNSLEELVLKLSNEMQWKKK
jgi:glycosyltransferase involved in cell wall biosynthesis